MKILLLLILLLLILLLLLLILLLLILLLLLRQVSLPFMTQGQGQEKQKKFYQDKHRTMTLLRMIFVLMVLRDNVNTPIVPRNWYKIICVSDPESGGCLCPTSRERAVCTGSGSTPNTPKCIDVCEFDEKNSHTCYHLHCKVVEKGVCKPLPVSPIF
jgi:hypothetical protein